MADSGVRPTADDDIRDLSRMAVDYARKAGLSEAHDIDLLKLVVAAYGAGVRRAAVQAGLKVEKVVIQ